MRAYQRIIRTLLSWRYLARVVVPLNLMGGVLVLLGRLDHRAALLLVFASIFLFIIAVPCLVDRKDFIQGPFNHGNPENQ